MFAKPDRKMLKEVSHCPAAHLLRPWEARAGCCDGCSRKVMQGEHVMDCRQCNWYVCSTCRPAQPSDGSIWNAVSCWMEDVAQEINDAAAEIGIQGLLQSNNTMLKDSRIAAAPVSEFDEEGISDAEMTRTERLVANFCERHPAMRVEPNAQELGELAEELAELPQGPAARTLCEQLSWTETPEWQPKLRALYVIEYLHWKGGDLREVAEAVHEKAAGLIQHLESDLRCKDQAARTLSALAGEAASSRWEEAPPRAAPAAAPAKMVDLLSFDDEPEPPMQTAARGGA